jgi:hypothetical protein
VTYEVGQTWIAPSGANSITVLAFSKSGMNMQIRNADNRETWMPVATDLSGWTLSSELRVTDPKTGGQKGQKDCQLGAVDPLALIELGKVAGFGAKKYARANYLKGYAWSLSIDALFRHILAMASGEDVDEESGRLHSACAQWHCAALTSFKLRGLGTDDRLKAPIVGAQPEQELNVEDIDQGGL